MRASNAKTSATANPLERELTLTRVFDAPRELVFQAWTEPEHLKHWWGPRGFTTPACEVDLRIGGTWKIVMRFPDGSNEHTMQAVYREIVPPERLSFTNVALDKDGKRLLEGRTTITFEEFGGKTKLVLYTRMTGLVSYADRMLDGMEPGWSQSLERLGEALAGSSISSDREIVATRVFDAPRDLVFQMWTDPKHISNWWGPRGFTTTTYAMDVRPGGVWRHVMHGPDGADYENEIVYIDVAKPERLVYDHVSPPRFQTTVTFVDQAGKTKVTARMLFESAALRNKVAAEHGAVEGLNQTLERLGEELHQMSEPAEQFQISRVFDAPRDLVWRAFTEPEHLMHWWGPKGFTMVTCKVDLRPGGVFQYCMRSPNGQEGWGKWVYREIVAPERLVTVVSFTDAEGNLLRHPMSPSWPLEMLHTMILTERDGKTTLTACAVPTNATEEERETFRAAYGSMEQGFTGTLDQLEAYLATKSPTLKLTTPSEREIVLTRVFDAPRSMVFDAMTKPEHLVHWFGPHGWKLSVCEVDLRPGGAWRWVLSRPGAKDMGMSGVYQEIAPPERLVSTERFDDYPGESLNTVTLVEQDGKTTYTNRVLYSSREIRDAVIKSGMEIGARETFDRLAGHLSSLKGEHQS